MVTDTDWGTDPQSVFLLGALESRDQRNWEL